MKSEFEIQPGKVYDLAGQQIDGWRVIDASNPNKGHKSVVATIINKEFEPILRKLLEAYYNY
jgi:hypothetical protein